MVGVRRYGGLPKRHSNHQVRRLPLSAYYTRLTGRGSLRLIFDRLFLQKLSSKKAKSVLVVWISGVIAHISCRFFFKKWLALEKSIGDDAGTELVKSRAIAWTQGSTAIGTSVAS